MRVTVGDYGNQTVAVVGGVTITAQPGQDGYIQGFVIRGGDGYSGGGDYGTVLSSELYGHLTNARTRPPLLVIKSAYQDTMLNRRVKIITYWRFG